MARLLYISKAPTVDKLLPAIALAGWNVLVARDIPDAVHELEKHQFGVGLARLEPEPDTWFRNGLDSVCEVDRHVPWIALVPQHTLHRESVCRAVWESFHCYHTLPARIEPLLESLNQAHEMAKLGRATHDSGREDVDEPQMVAASAPMQAVFRNIRKIAAADAPVLITGESGTGKELAARAIHERSRRAAAPFIAVNCAALPPTLIQSELFGHEKGAFTGASVRMVGRFESAHQGTILLDEIGDLLPEIQINLLRFLQENTIQRVGSSNEIQLDVRVFAATHVDLEEAVAGRRFREDLYYRLNVLRLEMPPLRERGDDIELLARFFFNRFARESDGRVRGYSQDALRALAGHAWPGNVREIINRVRRALVMCDTRLIGPADLGLASTVPLKRVPTLEEARVAAEREAIRDALTLTRSNLSDAARQLGISRPALYRRLEKYGFATSDPARP